MASRSFGVGSYGNAPSIVKESEFDAQVRARLNGESAFDDSSPLFEKWSPEKQRAAFEGMRRADANLTAINEEQFESAYNVARANNLLELDKAEIVKQQQADSNRRSKAERARIVNLSEEELETMPLEEIRRLDAIEYQKQMQQAGERGGLGL